MQNKNRRRASALSAITTIAAIGSATAAAPASATENANNAYPIGLNTLVTGIQPPPGDHFYNYTLYYDADRLNNADAKPAVPNFDAHSVVSAFRLIHTFAPKFFNFQPSMEVVLPVAHITLTNPVGHFSTTNVGDVNLGLILARHSPKFHDYAEVKIFVPTGSFDSSRPINAGRGYTSMALFYGATYIPSRKFDVGALMAYTFNFENEHTSYKSGQEFTLEASGNFQLKKGLYLGIGGYYYQQTTDDRLSNAIYRNGNRGMALAAGPQVRASLGRVAVGAKWQHEFRTENRPQGERFWFQLYVPLTGQGRARAQTLTTPPPTH